ncbi:MAG TPA: alpha-2-macroglobulin family protein, partial [Herpetosiphonaceae bacterium]
ADAEAALFVVDEAILALSGYALPDPLAAFYPHRESGVATDHSRPLVLLANDLDLSQLQQLGEQQRRLMRAGFAGAMPPPAAAPSAKAARAQEEVMGMSFSTSMDATINLLFGEGGGAPIAVRSNFNPLALFVPALRTDGQGRARSELTLPDNLTRYRVMAVAVAGERLFGAGEAALTARLPLMVRPSPPRFLNFGDQCELPVVLQNQTDEPLEVAVALRATNLALTQAPGWLAAVPANDRVEVRFPVAAEQAGTARFQVAATAGRAADAAEGSFPVWTPATGEAFATYGVIDEGAIVQPVAAPENVFPQFGGLEISQSSTALQALTDAVLYLQTYPFECAEQLSSRILAIAALRDVLQAFEVAGLPSAQEISEGVARGLEKLAGIQNEDGGFGFWRRDEESWPFVSVHAAHALQRARLKGWEVPGQALERAAAYLQGIDRRIPERYGTAARQTIVAYALFVRQLMGQSDEQRALALAQEAGGAAKLPLEAQGWLIPILRGSPAGAAALAEIRAGLANRVSETAATAQFVTGYGDDDYLILRSNRRADGILLDALITDQPGSDLIPKLVRGLLGHRVAGHWGTTQDNVFVLLALDHYFAAFERETPDFAARAWLGGGYAGEQRFQGRSTERRHLSIPMARLGGGEQRLTLAKEGPGRLYYRIGMRYAPLDLRLEPAQHGFAVERSYAAVDDPGDVRRDEDGTWRIRAGARIRVRLTLVAPARRYHVALVDPLPGGLEIENGALAVTGSQPADPAAPQTGWWWRPWFQHENLRDERAEAFAALLWEGVHTYSYLARATTPGSFVAPPPRAEEMYHPETFGRGASDLVVVE